MSFAEGFQFTAAFGLTRYVHHYDTLRQAVAARAEYEAAGFDCTDVRAWDGDVFGVEVVPLEKWRKDKEAS